MLFTPSNQKKLVNVCVVVLKRYGRNYELAVYPNKLYEYQRGMTASLDDVLQTETIYRSVSRGHVARNADLDLFGKPHGDIVKEILNYGHEQKNEVTRNYELEMIENEIFDILGSKVTKGGEYVLKKDLRDAMHKVHRIYIGDAKKQAQEILCRLEAIGFDRVGVKVCVKVDDKIRELMKGIGEVYESYVMVRGDKFPEFKRLCAKECVKYSIMRTEEASDEEIC